MTRLDELTKALKKFVKVRVPEVKDKREHDLYREKEEMYEQNKQSSLFFTWSDQSDQESQPSSSRLVTLAVLYTRLDEKEW